MKRTHGKRSIVYKLARVRALIKRRMNSTIERDARMDLSLALYALDHAKRHTLKAEHITAKTL